MKSPLYLPYSSSLFPSILHKTPLLFSSAEAGGLLSEWLRDREAENLNVAGLSSPRGCGRPVDCFGPASSESEPTALGFLGWVCQVPDRCLVPMSLFRFLQLWSPLCFPSVSLPNRHGSAFHQAVFGFAGSCIQLGRRWIQGLP